MDVLETIAGKLVAIAAGLAALGWLVSRAWQSFKRMDRILEALKRVEAEMRPNGGGTLRDAVDQLDAKLNETNQRLNASNERLDGVDQKLGAHLAEHAKAPVTVNVGAPVVP